ncbi:uncharacterized protein (DUF1330 family) [Microvirga flocculans]|uniref:Uncharacterized protein (DUF1330 family) n=1 Tax=Microvirga flocculans TaxID=217168 RepID=A0A7W6IC85_9HYPH|nr:DUF1330 domain-containing protein [Microvirga flocculans]MBB4038767.1 uncharacterized protein (DUF1330 family) [Microvirga flocculans]
MSTYAIGHLHDVNVGPDIVEYLRRIDETLAPFGGRFIIHGGPATVMEGSWSGDLIVIGFPDKTSARAWYDSPAYRKILPLRTGNSRGDMFFIDGVSSDHKAADILTELAPMHQCLG